MRFNKSGRHSIASVCDNLAIGLVYVAIIGHLGFDISTIPAGTMLFLSVVLIATAFFIRGYEEKSR
jgi:hypothetical protein